MSKFTRISIALLAIAAVAAPAFADSKISGYYRMQGVGQNIKQISDDSDTESLIDNRLRLRYQNDINDYVSVVYYGEVDTVWGAQSKGNAAGGIGGGGQLGADGVNVETKNAFLDFVFPDSAYAVRVGVQGFGDHAENTILADDMAGARLVRKGSNYAATLFYSKWDENGGTTWDDVDFYALQTDINFTDSVKGGLDLYWVDDNDDAIDVDDNPLGQELDLYFISLHGDTKMGNMGLNGFVNYVTGELAESSVGAADIDVEALMASAKLTGKMAGADLGLRLIYYAEDDDANDIGAWPEAPGAFEFHRENLAIFLHDIYYNNTGEGARAIRDAANEGHGLFGAVLSGNYKLPGTWYSKFGLGYFAAVDEDSDGDGVDEVVGTSLGTEVAAMVGTKVAEKVDISLRGAYAFLGDFYDAPAGSTLGDPDDLYKVTFMINSSF